MFVSVRRHSPHEPGFTGRQLVIVLSAAVGVSLAVIISARVGAFGIGALGLWPWLLSGLQVLSLWSAGRRRGWGWLLGGSVQLPWMAYAVLTDQIESIPGCVISAFVQIYSFLRNSTPQKPMEVMA